MNPFPNYIPKFNPYQYQGSGEFSNGIGRHTGVEIKSKPQQRQQQDDTIKNQLEAYQIKLDKQINDIQTLQQYNTRGLQATGMALNYLFNQSLPPNSSSSRNPNSFRPTPIDDTDRFGIIATNNFDYNSAVATGGDEEIPNQTDTQVEEIPVLEMLNK